MSGASSSNLVSATRRFSPPERFSTLASPSGQAQCIHCLIDLAVEIPQTLRFYLVLQLRHLIGGFVGVVRGDFVIAIDERFLRRHAFHHVVAHVLCRIELRLLRQIPHAHAIGRPRFAR